MYISFTQRSVAKLIIPCAEGWMQILRVLDYIYYFFFKWRQTTESFFWKRLINGKGFGSEQKTGRERERNRREQAGIMLVNVIKTVSPSGTNRDVSVLLMSLVFTWCSIILSLSIRLFFLFIFYTVSPLPLYQSVCRSALYYCWIPSPILFLPSLLTCTLIFLLLMCQQT